MNLLLILVVISLVQENFITNNILFVLYKLQRVVLLFRFTLASLSTMASSGTNRLGVSNEVRTLKIGKSFFNEDSGGGGSSGHFRGRKGHQNRPSSPSTSTSFHTIRYDFKPASVVEGQQSKLLVAEDGKGISIDVPTVDGNSVNYR